VKILSRIPVEPNDPTQIPLVAEASGYTPPLYRYVFIILIIKLFYRRIHPTNNGVHSIAVLLSALFTSAGVNIVRENSSETAKPRFLLHGKSGG
jgi:hypothetical protein